MLSVIIPACNEEVYLKTTIDAVRRQNTAHEVIVVSDASTDKTDVIASKHADKFLRLEKRQGPAHAKNAGAKLAKGEILIFLDADTVLTQDVLQSIEKQTKENFVGTCRIEPLEKKAKHEFFMWLKNYFLCPFGVSNGIIFCTKKTFEEFGRFPEVKKREDGLLLRKIKKAGKFKILKEPVKSSMRRFEKIGYVGVAKYWVKEALKPSDQEYPLIR